MAIRRGPRQEELEQGGYKPNGRVYPAELSAILNRTIHTIRGWESAGLPRDCRPLRDSRNWRYWTPEQVDRIREWLDKRPWQSEEKLEKMRRPRDRGVIHAGTETTREETDVRCD